MKEVGVLARQTNELNIFDSLDDPNFYCDSCYKLIEEEFYEYEREYLCEDCFDKIVKDYHKRYLSDLENDDFC